MNVSGKTWHARWFRFVQRQIGSDYQYRDGTNLCHYIRVVMVWGPLLVAFWIAVGILATITAFQIFVVAPYEFGGIFGVVGFWLFLLVCALIRHTVAKRRNTIRRPDSLIALAQKAREVKGKFCPVIKFDRGAFD